MRTTHSRLYLAAFTVWLLSCVALVTTSATTGAWVNVAGLAMFASNAVIFVLAYQRVGRGDAWRDSSGTVLPILAEFVLMSFGVRVPTAIAGLRTA